MESGMCCPRCRSEGQYSEVETDVELHENMLSFINAECKHCGWKSRYGPM